MPGTTFTCPNCCSRFSRKEYAAHLWELRKAARAYWKAEDARIDAYFDDYDPSDGVDFETKKATATRFGPQKALYC